MLDYDCVAIDVDVGHQQNDDTEWLNFLENDMPNLFPEISKQLETKKVKTSTTSAFAGTQVVALSRDSDTSSGYSPSVHGVSSSQQNGD